MIVVTDLDTTKESEKETDTVSAPVSVSVGGLVQSESKDVRVEKEKQKAKERSKGVEDYSSFEIQVFNDLCAVYTIQQQVLNMKTFPGVTLRKFY